MIARLMGLDTISPHELQRRLGEGTVAVFDVNARPVWLEARVPGARHLDPQTFEAVDLPENKGTRLVFYCSNPLCRKAPNAARRAGKMGYTRVQVMSAGIRGWLDRQLPTESGEPGSAS